MAKHEPRCLTKWPHFPYVWASDVSPSHFDGVLEAVREINRANQLIGTMGLQDSRMCEVVTSISRRLNQSNASINEFEGDILGEVKEGHLSCWQARFLYNKVLEIKTGTLTQFRDELISMGATSDLANLEFSDAVLFEREMDEQFLDKIYESCWCFQKFKAVS